jgi:hypothetical protein
MNPNQRSKGNNQPDNGANEKGTPGSQGNTASDAPLDHTYPQGAAQQQARGGTRQSGTGPAAPGDAARQPGTAGTTDFAGGSMQTQQTGGTGAVQGITDSHQRAMEQRSGAYGKLEQAEGEHSRQSAGASQQGASQGGTHQSNDSAGGLPRSPGNTGATSGPPDTHLTGAQVHANQQKDLGTVHKSNDLAGGYPKSPGGANKLAADEKMDDDTGFSNKP